MSKIGHESLNSPEEMQTRNERDTSVSETRDTSVSERNASSMILAVRDMDFEAIVRARNFTLEVAFREENSNAVKCRLEMLQGRWNDFASSCRRLQELCSTVDGFDENRSIYEQGETAYIVARGALQTRLDELSPQTAQPTFAEPNIVQVQLSDVTGHANAPRFSGDFAQWATFRDWVTTTVQDNKRLSNTERLWKLLSALDGQAKEAVGNWQASDERSFEMAWMTLKNQYNNDFQTIRAHLSGVAALSPIRRDSVDDVCRILNTTRNVQRELLLLLSPERLNSYQFLFQLEKLLNADSRREWEMRHQPSALPTLDEMFEFLSQRRALLAGLASAAGTTTKSDTLAEPMRNPARTTANTGQQQPPQTNLQNRRTGTQSSEASRSNERHTSREQHTSGQKCFKCQQAGHSLHACNQFRALSLVDRIKFIAGIRLCHGCFSSMHKTDRCPKEGSWCPRCKGVRHNSTICPLNTNIPAGTKPEATVTEAVAPQ